MANYWRILLGWQQSHFAFFRYMTLIVRSRSCPLQTSDRYGI